MSPADLAGRRALRSPRHRSRCAYQGRQRRGRGTATRKGVGGTSIPFGPLSRNFYVMTDDLERRVLDDLRRACVANRELIDHLQQTTDNMVRLLDAVLDAERPLRVVRP